MKKPLEPSSPRLSWSDPRSEDNAEAAHRDLLDFLASETIAPLLAADAGPQADVAPPSVPDEPVDLDERSCAVPVECTRPAPASTRRDADSEACERAARSAAQAVDEVTQENLRRLEATMSWLQKEAEARHLPRAPQIASARGVALVQPPPATSSAFDAIIDRSSFHRTVHGSSVHGPTVHGLVPHGAAARGSVPLPIWLREHEAPIRLPPPRRSGGLWQRIVKFFWACAVAAPIAYVFAITTSPLHKHLADVAGLRSAILLSLSAMHSPHAPSTGRELIAIAPLAAPEDSASVAPPGTSRQAVAAIPSGIVVMAPAPAEAGPARAAAAPTVAVVVPPDADRVGVPEAAHAPPAQPVVATAEAGEAGAATKPAARQDLSALTEQGKQFFEMGDLVAARILFMRAAKAGDATAAIAMGATYDPVVLAERGVRGVASDPDKARAWYERAKDMGSSEGPRRLEMLANR
jgi:hypothetical protein